MAGARKLPVIWAVVIGTLLLLSGTVDGNTAGDLPIHSEKENPNEEQYPRGDTNKTLLNKVSSSEQSIDDLLTVHDISVEDHKNSERRQIGDTKSTREDGPVTVKPTEPERTREPTSEETNNASKPEETLHDKLASKTTSRKTISEEAYRGSKPKGLATRTTKLNSEEFATRQDDKRNETEQQELEDNDALSLVGASVAKLSSQPSLSTREEAEKSANTERSIPLRFELRSKATTSVGIARERTLEQQESQVSTGPRGIQGAREEKEVSGLESKNSEAQELELANGKEDSQTISLINDTNVNYNPQVKNPTNNESENVGQQTGTTTNATNFISAKETTRGAVDPKEEVEVVKNVTQLPIERIVLDKQMHEYSAQVDDGKQLSEERKEESVGKGESLGTKDDEESKLTGNERIRSNEEEETISTPENNVNSVPRGRTIAFSGVNEFPSVETKTTAVPTKDIDVSGPKKNTSIDKILDQRPYPYLKPTKESITLSTPKINGQRSENSTTEENPAYENTIVRGDTEKKIVTEPSVVLENSIQIFKPDRNEKLENQSSKNSTTKSETLASTSTLITSHLTSTNETVIDQTSTKSSKPIGKKSEGESTLKNENEVSPGNEGSEVITTKDGNFDVTSNGITEVSPKPKNANKEVPYDSTFHLENGTTEVLSITSTPGPNSTKMDSSMDVQTDAEESLLIRSTLNVTEVSTEYPLIRETDFENSKRDTTAPPTTTLTSPIATNSSGASTEAKPTTVSSGSENSSRRNDTLIAPGDVTAIPEETSVPTTENVESLDLTQTSRVMSDNVTEKISVETNTESITELLKTTTVPVIQDTSTKEYSAEDTSTTIVPEVTTDIPIVSGEPETTSTYDTTTSTTTATTDESLIASTVIPTTTEIKIEETTTLWSILENQTEKTTTREDQEVRLTTVMDNTWSTTIEEDLTTVMDTESPLNPPDMRQTSTIIATETTRILTESTILDGTVTTSTDSFDISTSSSFVPSTLPPKMSTTSGEIPDEETNDADQNVLADEITSLVQIVVQGTSHEVCPKLQELREALAKLLKSGTNKSVHARQIIIHQNPCLEPPTSTPNPTDMPLMSILVYVVDEEGKFDSAMTNLLPSLYNSSMRFPVTIRSFLLVQEKDSGNAIAVVVVSSVAFICLVLLAGLLFIMRKRQTRFNYGERCRPVSLDAYSLDSVPAYNSVRRKGAVRSSKRSYGNPTFEDSSAIPSHPLNFAGLSTFCSDVNAINEEFAGIPQVTAKIDELPTGAEVKNRYANVIPLPETRVPLQKINNDALTEYINASYVRGPRNATRYYIACQAPMDSTVTDFWRMIWEQQSKVIIMLTDLVENDVEKCTEYIPPSEVTDCHRLYGDFQVTLKKRETKEKYAISTLQLKNLENNTFREVYHIWYLWPVNGVQSDGAGLIAVILEARALQRGGPGPIVVHCSPGTGRTGTLIALDLGIRQYEITRTVDVPRVVYTIRRDRAGAVQTKEQYAFIYKALNLYATKLAGGVLEST